MARKFAKLKARQSALSRLSAFAPEDSKDRPKQRRATHYDLWLTRSKKLIVSVRKFRTSPGKRAKSFRQWVVPLQWLPGDVREVAVRYKRTRRQPRARLHTFRAKAVLPTLLVAAGIVGVGYFSAQLVADASYEPASGYAVSVPEAEPYESTEEGSGEILQPSIPMHLKISSIDLNTEIMTVGKQTDNTMEVPPIEEWMAGWYEYGPTPGEAGPAVIVGHVDNREGPSIFWDLDELRVGDIVEVAREDGGAVAFEVYDSQSFDQDNFPTEKVYGDTEGSELRLITCGGEFDWRAGRYSHNTVVFAKLISDN